MSWHFSADVYGASACNVKKIDAVTSSQSFQSENPYFIVSVQPSHVKGTAYVVYIIHEYTSAANL